MEEAILTIRARIRTTAGALALLLLHPPEQAAAARPFLQAGLRWQALTRADGVALDYQALRPFLHFSSDSLGPYGLRLHLDAHGKKGLTERGSGATDPLADRLLVTRAHIELNGPARLHALAGRHRPPLRGLGIAAVDGISLQRKTGVWRTALTWGLQTRTWRPNAPLGGTEPQWGAEVEWNPTSPWEIRASLVADRDTRGIDRLRLGLGGSPRLGAALRPSLSVEADPTQGRSLAGRAYLAYRAGRFDLAGGYTWRLATPFPVFAPADSLDDGGQVRAAELSGGARWGRHLSARLHLRRAFGARPTRSERLRIAWRRLPFIRWNLTLEALETWSPWRQLAQTGLTLDGKGPGRLRIALGVRHTFFRWNTSRRPKWRGRTRPHLDLRYTGRAGWQGHLRLEETIDEFTRRRTRATVGLSFRR